MNGNQTDNSAADSGAAYVFVRSGTNWTQQAYLKASNTGASDHVRLFGGGVGRHGGGRGVWRGQQRHGSERQPERQQRASSGAAYVFVRNGTNWTQQAYLKASNTGAR